MINVSNIERFATHDGPGIRTTVFLKGCSLRCPWCANPETWTVHPIWMQDPKKCVCCGRCIEACRYHALSIKEKVEIDRTRCQACGQCAKACLQEAISISGKAMSISEILEEIQKDKAYYQASQGGITLSGGEPLFQEEAIDLIKAIHEEGYHLALETTGNYPLERLKKVISLVDLFLLDLKHIDPSYLEEVTKADPSYVFGTFDYLASRCPEKVILRIPVIPGFNFDHLDEMILFGAKKNFSWIHLLPYHVYGKNKWDQLRYSQGWPEEQNLDPQLLQPYLELGKQLRIHVSIGGNG